MNDDTISRQAAIDDILRRLDTLKMTEFGTGTFRDGVADGYARIISDLESLPSAQPERKADGETISRQAAIDALDGELTITGRENAETIRDYINGVDKKLRELPSAERRGRWIEEYSANHFQAKCSACGESTLYGITYDLEGNAYYMNYCPNCGAQMEASE